MSPSVRPHLEYRAQVWHTYLAKNTNALEKVHKYLFKEMELELLASTRYFSVTLAREPVAFLVIVYVL